jgi:hypothetical protein
MYMGSRLLNYINRIVIPAYSTLQNLISGVVQLAQNKTEEIIHHSLSTSLSAALTDLIDGNSIVKLNSFWQSAKSFTRRSVVIIEPIRM